MPVFLDGYQTTIGKLYATGKLHAAILNSFIKDPLRGVSLDVSKEGPVKPVYVTGQFDSEEGIPLFTHPYLFNDKGQQYLITDLRLFIKKDVFDGSVASLDKAIKNKTEYNFTKSRSIINKVWLEQPRANLKNDLFFSSVVYAKWISESISRTYGLDMRDQLQLVIAASYFYQTLFLEEVDIDEQYLQKFTIHTIKVSGASESIVQDVFKRMYGVNGLSDFISRLADVVDNVRLRDLNMTAFLTIIKSSWFGTNSKEIISVALEHPPTWMAIVFYAVNERTYKNSSIANVAEKWGKRGLAQEYVASFIRFVDSEKVKSSYTAFEDIAGSLMSEIPAYLLD